ncbi:hypothetical protein EVAR_68479_1, partial [Eumeta japonica]
MSVITCGPRRRRGGGSTPRTVVLENQRWSNNARNLARAPPPRKIVTFLETFKLPTLSFQNA